MAYDREAAGKLKRAVMQGDVKAARRLIKGGTDVNSVSFQMYWKTSLLHEAVITGKDEMVQILLNAGSDVNSSDVNGNTALHLACRRNNIDVVNALLKSRARTDRVNEDGYTALRIALLRSGPQVVESLLNAGAQRTHCDEHMLSNNWAMNIAVSRHDLGPSVVQALIDKGARINHLQMVDAFPLPSCTQGKGQDAGRVHGALDCHFLRSIPDVDSIRILLQHGADPFQALAGAAKTIESGDFATDYLNRNLGQFILKIQRIKEGCTIRRNALTAVVGNFTDQDLVDELVQIAQSDTEKGSVEANSQSDSRKKSRVGDSSQSESGHFQPVKSLSHKCRVVVRRHLSVINKNRTIKKAISKLPLPKPLIDYIACEELVSLLG